MAGEMAATFPDPLVLLANAGIEFLLELLPLADRAQGMNVHQAGELPPGLRCIWSEPGHGQRLNHRLVPLSIIFFLRHPPDHAHVNDEPEVEAHLAVEFKVFLIHDVHARSRP